MAITKAIPQVWAARIYDGFQRANVWSNLATDISGELADGGNQINLTKISSGVQVRDYSRNTDIAAPQILTDAQETLDVDQEKYFNIAVDDLDQVQAKPALLSHFALQAGREIAQVHDQYMYESWRDGIAAANTDNTIPAGDLSISPGNGKKLLNKMNEHVEDMDKENWPEDGRWVVFAPRAASLIRSYLIDVGVIGTGQANESVLVNAAISRILGFQVRVDKGLPDAAAAAGATIAIFGHSSGMLVANQVRRIEAYRPENRFADAVKGLFVYGAHLVNLLAGYKFTRKA